MIRLIAAAAMAAFAMSAASAQVPKNVEKFYDGPTKVNLGGRPVVASISLYQDKTAPKGDLKVTLVTDVTDFIVDVEKDLEKWVASRQDPCGERWGAGKPQITFPPGKISFALDIELQYWTCGFDGKGDPAQLAREGGSVEVTLDPFVTDGLLQARLGAFTISNRSGVSKYLPLEFVMRRVLEQELKRLNENPKFRNAPKPLIDEGLSYETIVGIRNAKERVIINARYVGKGGKEKLDRIAQRMKAEGLTQ
jgi:hypothetical protein